MQDIQLKSGNVLKFGLPPIIDSIRLTNTVAKVFSNRGLEIKLDRDSELSFSALFDKNPDAFIKGLADIIFEEYIMELVLKCAEKCLYVCNGVSQKITLDTFDNEKNRADFYEVMIKIAIENIRPFFGNLLTALQPTSELVRRESDQV
ncbi:MAG: hypothetical protein UE295_12030 [Acutalibacteraceae bacterium]|nr:hypothetical protein [Acutalibacteraceae bacterium]